MASPSASTRDAFRSARLIYRAVDVEKDKALFNAINDDHVGFQNSNAGNVRLSGPADAERFLKHCAEDVLMCAVICLPEEPPAPTTTAATPTATSDSPEAAPSQQSLPIRSSGNSEPGASGTDAQHQNQSQPQVQGRAGVPIGQILLSGSSVRTTHHRNTEIGIDILPPFQGQGYGTEVILWALRIAFERFGLHRVVIRAFEYNEGAVRLYRRLGFKEEGRSRESLWFEGRWWDGFSFGMLEGEWRELRKEGKF
ncbi:acyl-CoA N-acyltransferase [Clohesyomyces aquaticus]|uniref:Acyl-CoA N-acyltransferase n=1 Tax=Clohesyomyces aquaticus TaxID=1231657 RepID=A0A1Y1ZV01_9PLEO|nr:acyl-CoA N-acyltransferase [Clohesyomyces aquaticus]